MTFFQKHEALIRRAIEAIHERTFYTPYPEHHKQYDQDLIPKAKASFEQQVGAPFSGLQQTGLDAVNWKGEEVSPYTQKALGVTYPQYTAEELVSVAESVQKIWKAAEVEDRVGILAEALDRLQERYFDLTYATMHTTGQSFMMAFQASGPHSNDRALEATALAFQELTRFPREVRWEKPMGKSAVKLDKTWQPVPRGIALAIGCSTFPVWNTVPGLFANLACGNPVIVKPHPGAVLPIAIVVSELQKVLVEAGYPADIVQLAADTKEEPLAWDLADDENIKIIDYTGGNTFGEWLEGLQNKIVFTEKAGVNTVILDEVDNLDSVLSNLAFSVSLYSGQMCTAPQNIFISAEGVKTNEGIVPFDQVVSKFKQAVLDLVEHPKMGAGTLAALQNDQTLKRLSEVRQVGEMVLESRFVEQPEFEQARTVSPALRVVSVDEKEVWSGEWFGPISFMIKTADTNESIRLAAELAREKGAITCAAYTLSEEVELNIREAMEASFTPVSFNLEGFIWVNQAAAFSDFHVTGGNPAGNASFADPAFVTRRFVWVGHRKMVR